MNAFKSKIRRLEVILDTSYPKGVDMLSDLIYSPRIGIVDNIIKDSYFIVMKRNTSLDKLELLKRFLKMKYNVAITIKSLKMRDKQYKKEQL